MVPLRWPACLVRQHGAAAPPLLEPAMLSLEFKVAVGGALVGFLSAMLAYMSGQRLAAKLGAAIPGDKMY